MNPLVRLRGDFEGAPLTTLTLHGRPAWIAREVGAAVGYSHGGKRLANKIGGDWSDEFIEGVDHQVLRGPQLALLKDALPPGTESVPPRASALLVLFESGLHLALTKTNKPVGRRLRRFLVDQVLPQLTRTGRFEPQQEEEEGLSSLQDRREHRLNRRLALQARRLRLRERGQQRTALRELVQTLHELGQIDAHTRAAYEVRAAELVLGHDLSELRPPIPHAWLTPTQIGRELGLSAYHVGCVITELGLRGNRPGLSRARTHFAGAGARPVVSYVYSPEAQERIAEHTLGGRQ